MKKKTTYLLAALITSSFSLSGSVLAAEFKIGILAKNGPSKAISKWGSLGDYLTNTITGDSFTIVPLGFDDVEPAIKEGKVDYFLVNSSMFVTSMVNHGASAVATMINSRQGKPLKGFGGVILTYADRDDINNMTDIKGKKFMAVKESSFGGWQMAYKEFLDSSINPATDFASLEFGGKHDNVVYAIQNGAVDAGTVRTDTLERMVANGDIDLSEFKIINAKQHSDFPFVSSTSLYPEWPFAKVAATKDEDAKKVLSALLSLDANTPAAEDAKIVGWSEPLDYSGVDKLQQQLSIGAYK
jgi:twitching motility protein PilJ